MTNNDGKKERIVILGSGIGAMAAACALTTPKNWQDKYDITVYQMGWRLGGKGATGRDVDHPERILEHGLHVWFGCYANAFHMMYQVYEELGRAPGSPLATVEEAFDPHSQVNYIEYINDEWVNWCLEFPRKPDFPGVPRDSNHPDDFSEFNSLWDYFIAFLELVHDHFHSFPDVEKWTETDSNRVTTDKPHWWQRVIGGLKYDAEKIMGDVESDLLKLALKFARSLESDHTQHHADDHNILSWMLNEFKKWLWDRLKDKINSNVKLRRLWIMLDLGITGMLGFLKDGVLWNGFNPLDQYDLREWFLDNGASEMAVNSGIINAIYDSFFAYKNGDSGDREKGIQGQPDFAAGSALASIMWMLLNYKGAIIFRMRAGTGDTVFAPIYQVLSRRGVKFEFFHRVTQLTASDNQVSEIHINKQVNLTVDEYQPLILVKDLPCWPSEPQYEQIQDGDILKAKGVDLESRWYVNNWQDVEQLTLKVGQDFDKVIWGLSFEPLKDIGADLVAQNADWQTSVNSLTAIKTESLQLWFTPPLDSTCGTDEYPMTSGYEAPFASWAPFEQLIPWENQPTEGGPQRVYYSSNAMKDDDDGQIPPPDDSNYPAEQAKIVEQHGLEFLKSQAKPLWPQAAADSGELNWETLYAPAEATGEERYKSQYWRANIDPSERYVLSPSGTNNNRISPADSGYLNLYVVGTFTYNWAFNVACMEVATMSGLQASRAICGYPKHIVGEHIR